MRTMNRLTRVFQASRAQDTNTRLQAALAAGTDPTPQDVGALIAQCATEPDFFVRDMLTWALTRHPAGTIVPLLLAELREGSSRQRQAVALQDGSPSVRSLVASYLDEPDLNAAGALRWAIVRQGTAAIDALTAAGSDAPAAPADPTIRRRISEALAEVVHQLFATITPAATVEQRLRIVQTLGDLPGDAAHEALTRLAADPDPRVAGTARHLGH